MMISIIVSILYESATEKDFVSVFAVSPFAEFHELGLLTEVEY